MRDYRKPQKLDLSGWQSAGRMEFEIVKLMNPHLAERAKAMTDIPSPQPAHTPGPWKVIETHYLPHDGDHVADMSNGLMVVPCFGRLGDPLADARLIAAAPDLLDALTSMRDTLNRNGYDTSAANAAIAKATGAQA